jgi:hypothetical protein
MIGKNCIKSLKQSHILSGFRLNLSQKKRVKCVSHVFEPISIIHLLSSFKNCHGRKWVFVSPEQLVKTARDMERIRNMQKSTKAVV